MHTSVVDIVSVYNVLYIAISCTCSGGTAAVDDACPGDGFEKCILCDPGYLLDESSELCRNL